MELLPLIFVMLSAIMHAGWNLMAKKNRMSISFYLLLGCTCVAMTLHTQFWTPIPVWSLPAEFWLYLAGSVFFDGVVYCRGLMHAYRKLDISIAYPIMRSLPIIFTGVITSLLALGKPLTPAAMAGMGIVFCGCILMPLPRFSDFNLKKYLNPGMLWSLLVAAGTTGYTIFDKEALNALQKAVDAQSLMVNSFVVSLTYYSTREILLNGALLVQVLLLKEERQLLKEQLCSFKLQAPLAGVMACFTYFLVLLAMSYVSNVSYVQAFRQIGLVFAVAGGILFLHERVTAPKIVGSLLIVAGLLLTIR